MLSELWHRLEGCSVLTGKGRGAASVDSKCCQKREDGGGGLALNCAGLRARETEGGSGDGEGFFKIFWSKKVAFGLSKPFGVGRSSA